MNRLNIRDLEGRPDQVTVVLYQNGQPYTGRVYEELQGRLDIEYDVVAGQKQGTETEYYPSGQVQSVREYRQNVLDGPLTRYYENGLVEERAHFEQGVCTRSTTFDEAGQVLEEYTLDEHSPEHAWLQALRQQEQEGKPSQ